MPTLESLNRKIKTAHDLLGVVRTMKSLAAVNIRQFEQAVASLEQYRLVVDTGWTVFLRMGRPMDSPSRHQGNICLVVGSDQGMCGPFNESLWPFAHERSDAQAIDGRYWNYWSVGEKIHGILADAGVPADVHFTAPAGLNAINEQIRAVIGQIEKFRLEKKLEQFAICHHVLGEHGGYAPVFQRVLPLDASWAAARRSTPWPNRCLPMLGASRETMFTSSPSGNICSFRSTGPLLSHWPPKMRPGSWPCRPLRKTFWTFWTICRPASGNSARPASPMNCWILSPASRRSARTLPSVSHTRIGDYSIACFIVDHMLTPSCPFAIFDKLPSF